VNAQDAGAGPRERLLELLGGKWLAAAVSAAATLGLADLLEGGSQSGAEIAEALGCEEDALERLLRTLVGIGIVSFERESRYALTDLGRCLGEDDLGPLARFVGSEFNWAPWARLAEGVRTGRSAFELQHGDPLFEYLDANEADAAVYHDAIGAFVGEEAEAVAKGFDFSSSRRVVDVGGGRGALLEHVLRRWPDLDGILVERPAVAQAAQRRLVEAGLIHRAEVRTGDFFEAIPEGADVYMLKHVVHCLADAEAVELLDRCRRSLACGGAILVIEGFRLPPGNVDQTSLLDLEMLALCGPGRERSKPEMRRLLQAAGLRLVGAPAIGGGARLIEARPVAAAT